MKQQSLGLGHSNKRTRRREYLGEMERVVPWAVGRTGGAGVAVHARRPPGPTALCGGVHAAHDLLTAKGLLLKSGTVVHATLIDAPSSTQNASGEPGPEMKQSKKGNQWYFGMKCHIGVDADSGLVHTVRGTAGSVNDVVEANSLLHSQETEAWGDAGYQGAHKRPDARAGVNWNVAMCPGQRKALDTSDPRQRQTDEIERIKARIRAKVEHPFRVVKRQFGHVKFAPAAWPRTRRSCTRCLRWPICGWPSANSWQRWHECVCCTPNRRVRR